MRAIDAKMHEIRQRFVEGLLLDMNPQQLRNFVTVFQEEAGQSVRKVA